MSLNEECLLNYLLKSFEFVYTIEILKLNNKILEKEFVMTQVFNKIDLSSYINNKGV